MVSCGVAVNTPDALRPVSVGRPLDTVEVTLAADGEVLVAGRQVMKGHRDAPDKTAAAIDVDGWLHTGDIGRIDEDGFLWIVDRKEEIIINAAGKYMAQTAIEMAVRSAGNLVEQVDRANETLARVEQIKTFAVLPDAWQPGHELTPTMQVRHHVIDDLYATQIEELYA